MSSGRVICLGEALVDLVCPVPAAGLGEASEFVPALGGSLANVAVVAARYGASVEFLGGAGGDEWGRWLRERLGAEGVGVGRFAFSAGTTSLAFVALSAQGEPSFSFYEATERPAAGARAHVEAALGAPAGEGGGVLVLGSDSMLGAEERAVTLRAAELARERGWIVLADPNLRPARWRSAAAMRQGVAELLAAADVVKCNAAEAGELSGRADAKAAARRLLAGDQRAAVVTRGAEGALIAAAGGALAEVPAAAGGDVVDATGAGDSVTGVLAAGLAAGAPAEALAPVAAVAMQAAAGVVGAWGAAAGLPPAERARRALADALSA